jgi:hypothetical protein
MAEGSVQRHVLQQFSRVVQQHYGIDGAYVKHHILQQDYGRQAPAAESAGEEANTTPHAALLQTYGDEESIKEYAAAEQREEMAAARRVQALQDFAQHQQVGAALTAHTMTMQICPHVSLCSPALDLDKVPATAVPPHVVWSMLQEVELFRSQHPGLQPAKRQQQSAIQQPIKRRQVGPAGFKLVGCFVSQARPRAYLCCFPCKFALHCFWGLLHGSVIVHSSALALQPVY